jgi:hypothetical protein
MAGDNATKKFDFKIDHDADVQSPGRFKPAIARQRN